MIYFEYLQDLSGRKQALNNITSPHIMDNLETDMLESIMKYKTLKSNDTFDLLTDSGMNKPNKDSSKGLLFTRDLEKIDIKSKYKEKYKEDTDDPNTEGKTKRKTKYESSKYSLHMNGNLISPTKKRKGTDSVNCASQDMRNIFKSNQNDYQMTYSSSSKIAKISNSEMIKQKPQSSRTDELSIDENGNLNKIYFDTKKLKSHVSYNENNEVCYDIDKEKIASTSVSPTKQKSKFGSNKMNSKNVFFNNSFNNKSLYSNTFTDVNNQINEKEKIIDKFSYDNNTKREIYDDNVSCNNYNEEIANAYNSNKDEAFSYNNNINNNFLNHIINHGFINNTNNITYNKNSDNNFNNNLDNSCTTSNSKLNPYPNKSKNNNKPRNSIKSYNYNSIKNSNFQIDLKLITGNNSSNSNENLPKLNNLIAKSIVTNHTDLSGEKIENYKQDDKNNDCIDVLLNKNNVSPILKSHRTTKSKQCNIDENNLIVNNDYSFSKCMTTTNKKTRTKSKQKSPKKHKIDSFNNKNRKLETETDDISSNINKINAHTFNSTNQNKSIDNSSKNYDDLIVSLKKNLRQKKSNDSGINKSKNDVIIEDIGEEIKYNQDSSNIYNPKKRISNNYVKKYNKEDNDDILELTRKSMSKKESKNTRDSLLEDIEEKLNRYNNINNKNSDNKNSDNDSDYQQLDYTKDVFLKTKETRNFLEISEIDKEKNREPSKSPPIDFSKNKKNFLFNIKDSSNNLKDFIGKDSNAKYNQENIRHSLELKKPKTKNSFNKLPFVMKQVENSNNQKNDRHIVPSILISTYHLDDKENKKPENLIKATRKMFSKITEEESIISFNRDKTPSISPRSSMNNSPRIIFPNNITKKSASSNVNTNVNDSYKEKNMNDSTNLKNKPSNKESSSYLIIKNKEKVKISNKNVNATSNNNNNTLNYDKNQISSSVSKSDDLYDNGIPSKDFATSNINAAKRKQIRFKQEKNIKQKSKDNKDESIEKEEKVIKRNFTSELTKKSNTLDNTIVPREKYLSENCFSDSKKENKKKAHLPIVISPKKVITSEYNSSNSSSKEKRSINKIGINVLSNNKDIIIANDISNKKIPISTRTLSLIKKKNLKINIDDNKFEDDEIGHKNKFLLNQVNNHLNKNDVISKTSNNLNLDNDSSMSPIKSPHKKTETGKKYFAHANLRKLSINMNKKRVPKLIKISTKNLINLSKDLDERK